MARYDFISDSDIGGIAMVMKNGKWGFVNANNIDDEIIAPVWNEKPIFEHSIYIVTKGAKVGAVSIKGAEIIPAVYDELYAISQDIIIAQKNDKWGIIDGNGKERIPFAYDELEYFSQKIIVAHKQDKVGIISIENEEVIPFEFDAIRYCDSDVVKVRKNGLYGCIRLPNTRLLKCIYESIYLYREYIVANQEDKSFLFTYDGRQLLTSNEYSELILLNDNLFLATKKVMSQRFDGVIDSKGKIIIPFKYLHIVRMRDDYVKVENTAGKWGLFNKEGKQICEAIYEDIYSVDSEYIIVENNNKRGVVDLTGRKIVDCLYQRVKPYDFNKHGYMRALREGKWTLVNTNGEEILPCIYDQMDFCEDEIIGVTYNGEFGYVRLD